MHRSSRLWLLLILLLLLSLFGCADSSASSGDSALSGGASFSENASLSSTWDNDVGIAPLGCCTIVYITDTGECYHRGDCGYLHSSRHPITKDEAIRRGYRPCSRCKP